MPWVSDYQRIEHILQLRVYQHCRNCVLYMPVCQLIKNKKNAEVADFKMQLGLKKTYLFRIVSNNSNIITFDVTIYF